MYIPQEQGGPVITPGTGFPFRRLLRLTELRWKDLNFRVGVRVTLRAAVYRQSIHLGAEPLQTHGQNFFSQLNTCSHSPYITSSLTRGWVCHLKLLLALASAFILGPESREIPDHI
jgi:hypothetical protein